MSTKSPIENNLRLSLKGCNHQRKMLPSNHGKNSISHAYSEQYLFGDQTFSRNGLPTSYFFQFSPSLVDDSNHFLNYDHELLSGQQLTQFPHPLATANAITSAAAEGVNNTTVSSTVLTEDMVFLGTAQNLFPSKNDSPNADGRKRSRNRERHSKIFTAQGLRDRRMRLSVDVAHKFFGLQDMLGFDKASKTVSWLLAKSKAAIKEFTRGLSQTEGCGYSISESEDMSGIDETTVDVDQQEKDLKGKSSAADPKMKRIRGSQKATLYTDARGSRAIARAKARERTREKMIEKLEKSKQVPKENTHDPNQLRPLSPLESSAGSRTSHEKKFLELGFEINDPNKLGLSVFDYHHHISNSLEVNTCDLVSFNNNYMMNFFPENWDMDSTRTRSSCCDIPNMNLFTGF